MKSLRLLDRHTGYSLASLGLLLGLVVPSLMPAFASAGTLTTRSMAMSDSSVGATANYKLTFTPATSTGATGGIVIDFCADTPLITNTCTVPTGFSAASATASTGTITAATNSIKLVTATTATTPFTVTFTGITNSSTAATFYARVMSYDGTTNPIANHTSTTAQGAYSDNGSIAMSTTNAIGVKAYVLESMTFCVSGTDPGKNCATGVSSPSMILGETVGTSKALSASAVSTGQAFAQLSTNASSGAIVSLKSNALGCGGLFRNGVLANCEIGPQTSAAGNVVAGTAGFGLEVGTVTAPGNAIAGDMIGTLTSSGSYSNSKYFMDFVTGDASGVTGPYGSALFSSVGAPVSNKNIPLTFGATINNNTPAGVYGANLSLIATGTF